MANEILKKSRDQIIAQAGGTALTAALDPNSGSYTGGAATTIDNTIGTTNGKGADHLQLRLDVTSAPAATTTAEIWYRGSEDGTTWTKWKFSHTVNESIILTTATLYGAGLFALSFDYTQIKVVSVGSAFTATLYATPKLQEVQ